MEGEAVWSRLSELVLVDWWFGWRNCRVKREQPLTDFLIVDQNDKTEGARACDVEGAEYQYWLNDPMRDMAVVGWKGEFCGGASDHGS